LPACKTLSPPEFPSKSKCQFASHSRASEALQWYRRAAAQGNVEGEYRAGNMLLFGGFGNPKALAVQPNRAEGIRWTFMAATNGNPQACYNMARVLREAVINGKTLSEGESASVPFKSGTLAIKCLKIEKDSVLISLDGEDAPRLLRVR